MESAVVSSEGRHEVQEGGEKEDGSQGALQAKAKDLAAVVALIGPSSNLIGNRR